MVADRIDNIIVLMLENRSFDHFFGAVPNVDGIDPANPASNLERPGSTITYAQTPNAVRKMRPDPRHSLPHVLRQINGDGLGTMGGFVYDIALAEPKATAAWHSNRLATSGARTRNKFLRRRRVARLGTRAHMD